jgi:sensor domain CHASE-containing protein
MLFVIVTVAALFGLMIVGARAVVLGSFDRIEGRAAATTDADAAKIVATLADEFVERGADWSDWDDLAQYAADGNQEFRDGNLTADGLGSVNWDHLLIIRGDGTLVYGQRWVRADNTLTAPAPELLALVADGALAPADDWDQSRGGFALIGGELHMVASRGVHMTDHRRGTVAARLITTRVVDEAWMARLRRFVPRDRLPAGRGAGPDPRRPRPRGAARGVPRHTVATDQAHHLQRPPRRARARSW